MPMRSLDTHPRWRPAIPLAAVLAAATLLPGSALAVERAKFQSGGQYLVIELLRDDLLHFEAAAGPGPAADAPLSTTPQVAKTDYPGPTHFTRTGTGGTTLSTPGMKVVVDPSNLCMTITDTVRGLELTRLCPQALNADPKVLSIAPGAMQNLYGLGEQFITPGEPDGDWTAPNHQVRTPGDSFGNQMVGYNGGAVGNAQFPILYALGAGEANYALFLDLPHKQRWDFAGNPWKVETSAEALRGYVFTGADLPALRTAYMDLTGHPPVPPRKMFGLWVSEYGFENWSEVNDKLTALRADQFPVDGFVLDLQWFGGVPAIGTNPSRMGSLTWDTKRFPAPADHLADYAAQGIGLMTIEESYIDRDLPEHQDLASREFLVKQCRNGNSGTCDTTQPCPAAVCPPVYLTQNPWWGKGGMLDWTQDAAGAYWHDQKRQPLIEAGIIGHWIDLGEPEQYGNQAGQPDWTAGVVPGKHGHADYHNLYNFKWAQSIADGYARHQVARRPFMMARTGAPGIQRFGTSLWSGDIGSNPENLATHMNAQMHMSLSGIDYFGSDIGGFHRTGLNGADPNLLFTQWFADGMMVDIPGRTHVNNSGCPYPAPSPTPGNCYETAPDHIGDKASNLANLRLRYALGPYLYSLAHRAWLNAEPVAPPLVYYYQADPQVRRIGSEKLLGRDLLVALVADRNAPETRDVYLPAGDWVDYHTNEWVHSGGETVTGRPLKRDGVFQLPLFARAGAVIPLMHVDDKTQNVFGRRADGATRNDLIVRTYASALPTGFTLYEDDGQTQAYRDGVVRTTALTQQLAADGKGATVTIAPANGTYQGAPAERAAIVELVTDGKRATGVTLNGTALPALATPEALDAADAGWVNAGPNLIRAKSAVLPVVSARTFVFALEPAPIVQKPTAAFQCRNGNTVWGQSVYVVGSVPELGNWNPAKALKLAPNGPYPVWTSSKIALPPATAIEWKCIKRAEAGDTSQVAQWQPGANNSLLTTASGDAGVSTGDFNGGTIVGTVAGNFVCDNGTTTWGQSVYVVGNTERLGNWVPAKAVKLDPTNYPRWSGTIDNLPAGKPIKWKCIKRPEGAAEPVVWQSGGDISVSVPASGTFNTAGNFQP